MLGRLAVAASLGLLFVLQQAHALGLGDIQVQSKLNQRFSAVVPFTSLSDEEATSVKASIAGNDAFARAGLDRSAYLSTLKVEVVTSGERPRIVLSSQNLAREPLLTLLLEVRTAGGPRVLREYTVLLDPPVVPVTAAPVPAETAADGPQGEPAPEFFEVPAGAATTQPLAAEPSGDTPAAATVSPVSAEGEGSAAAPPGRYTVRRGDALWKIANAVRPTGAGMNQTILGLYQANPRAFADGDINRIIVGSELQVPSSASLGTLSESDARARVWDLSAGTAAPVTEPVAPVSDAGPAAEASDSGADGAAAVATDAETQTPPVASIEEGVEAVRTDPADPASVPETAGAGAATGDGAVVPTPDAPAAAVAAVADPATDSAMYDEEETEESTTPATAPASAAAGEAATSSGWLSRLWPLLILLAVLLAIVVVVRSRREQRAQQEFDDARASMTSSMPVPRPKVHRSDDDDATAPGGDDDVTRIVPPVVAGLSVGTASAEDDPEVMEALTRTARVPAYTGPVAGDSAEAAAQAFEASTAKVELTENDPLAEAEFHIAYGLYEEAALLLQQASAQDPERIELRAKLAETYFASGQADRFVQTARGLKDTLGQEAWSKVAIMGRQLCPDEPLFRDGEVDPGTDLDLDLALDAPTDVPVTTVDEGLEFRLEELELPDQVPEQTAQRPRDENMLEFDLGEFDLSGSQVQARTPRVEHPGQVHLDDFDLAGPSLGARPAPDLEELSLSDLEAVEASGDPFAEADLDTGNDAGTKLDLARAYLEMGDSEMAGGLLDEVITSGTAEQRAEAEVLRARLNG